MLAIVVAVMLLLATTGRSLSFHAVGVTVGQCRPPAHTQPVSAPAYEPVWRTFTDAPDRFSLSLPATWDAAMAGGAIPTRSPWLGDSLQRMLTTADPSVRLVAAGRPGAPDLFVETRPVLPGDSLDCRLTISGDPGGTGLPAGVRGARIHLLAGDANETVFTATESTGGRMVEFAYYRFSLLQPSPRRWLVLLFAAPRAEADRAEPVFWQIAESLRLGRPASETGAESCLVTAPTRPDVRSAAGRVCPVPVGEPYFRLDCFAAVFSESAATASVLEYDLASGNSTGAARLAPGDRACRASIPAGRGFAIELAKAGLADLVVAIDFVATSTAHAYVGLAARRSSDDEVYTTFDTTTGSAGVWQRRSGQDTRVASRLADDDVRATHRLVLLVAGGKESAWLDDQSISTTSR